MDRALQEAIGRLSALNADIAERYKPESKPAQPRRGKMRDCPPITLPDGSLGYFVAAGRLDDCFRPALATVLQVPPKDCPDWRLDERLKQGWGVDALNEAAWRELAEWLIEREVQMVFHPSAPVNRRRWMGVVPAPEDAEDAPPFASHCLVMNHGEVLHDPLAIFVDAGRDIPVFPLTPKVFSAADVTWGLSFEDQTH